MAKSTYFFLGANSREGFSSLYDNFADVWSKDFLWLIKGGPGCGKSSFMGKIGKAAENAGLSVEYIRCSGDPGSLDGVYIPERHLAYVDATAPHKMDAVLPAAGDAYLDLGAFYCTGELAPHKETLADINRRYKGIYSRAYSLLRAAGEMDAPALPGLIDKSDLMYAQKRAMGVADREFGRVTKPGGKQHHRFLSAISCHGLLRLYDTVNTICDKVFALDDELGLADGYLRTLLEQAGARSLDTIACHDPLYPERLEALLIPELKLGFVANRPLFGASPVYDRNVRLDAIVPREHAQKYRRKLRFAAKTKATLLEEAVAALKEAKQLHDEMEAVYNPHVDFDGLYELCDKHIEAILRN